MKKIPKIFLAIQNFFVKKMSMENYDNLNEINKIVYNYLDQVEKKTERPKISKLAGKKKGRFAIKKK